MLPKRFFLVSGSGRGRNEIEAFEMALRDAGIEGYNFVPVSSIIPKNCVRVSPEEGKRALVPGQIVFCILAKSIVKNGKASAAVAYAYSKDVEHGYFVEISHRNEKAKEEAIETAKFLFKSKFGKEPEVLDAVSAECEANDGYACAIAVAVLLE